jgi:small nuclear ribonucleoprotein (snRNP)-like protein
VAAFDPDGADWGRFLGRIVVVDTDSSFLYLGTLKAVSDHFVVLEGVDVHDRRETPTTKEKYVLDAKRYGVRPNLKDVSIRKSVIVSLSRLEDVLDY